MNETTANELIKFLSDLTIKLGVAEHVYVVGGAVRNFVLKKPIKDIDIVIDSIALNGKDSEWLAKEISKVIPSKIATNQYGVAILTIINDWILGDENMKGEVLEIANARTETYSKGYKPDDVKPSTIEDDINRREFRMNTLLWKMSDLKNGPQNAKPIDLTGHGIKDIEKNEMNCPRDPDIVFSDDPSRIIRSIKFNLKYGFKITDCLKDSIKKNAEKIRNIPPAHLANMLINDFLDKGYGVEAFKKMQELGIFDVIKDIIEKNSAVKQTLNNWVDSSGNIKLIFELADIGLSLGKKLNFLDSEQKNKLKNIIQNFNDKQALRFVEILNQPGKIINTERIINTLGLRGQQISKIRKLFIELVLKNPNILSQPHKIEDFIIDNIF